MKLVKKLVRRNKPAADKDLKLTDDLEREMLKAYAYYTIR